MKAKEKQQAIELRRQGYTIPEIEKTVGCPRSSVHTWVQGVPVPKDYLERIKSRQRQASELRALGTRKAWEKKYEEAVQDYVPPFDNPRFTLGLGLYLGEGEKYGRHAVGMSNCQPSILVAFRKWIDEFYKIEGTDYRAHVHIHDIRLAEKAIEWWEKQLSLPKEKFYKATVAIANVSQRKRNTLEYGTCAFYVRGKNSWKIGACIRKAMKLFEIENGPVD